MCNGILAGLVSITAPCGNVESGSAVAIGAIGGIICTLTSLLLKKLKIDDPVDAFAVHGACGFWGVVAAALFDWGEGDYFNGWSGFTCTKWTPPGKADEECLPGAFGDAFAANIAGLFAIIAWVGGWSVVVFLPLRLLGVLRASDEVQETGLDQAKHSPMNAYVMGPMAGPVA